MSLLDLLHQRPHPIAASSPKRRTSARLDATEEERIDEVVRTLSFIGGEMGVADLCVATQLNMVHLRKALATMQERDMAKVIGRTVTLAPSLFKHRQAR